MRKSSKVLADELFDHCFNYFMLGRCPKITLIDDDIESEGTIKINDRATTVACHEPKVLPVDGHDVRIFHVQRKPVAGNKHEAHLCAHERVVESFSLVAHTDLSAQPFHNENGDAVIHHTYVSGEVLDDAVDATRTRFNLPENDSLLATAGILNLQRLRSAIGQEVNERLGACLKAEREANFERVSKHIRTNAPEYRHLITRRPEEIRRIPWSENPRKIGGELHRIETEWFADVETRKGDLESRIVKGGNDFVELDSEIARVVSEVNEQGQAGLVRYVVKRRSVLTLLNTLISSAEGPASEGRVHNIVFPTQKSGDEIEFEDHNLWLIDDRLAFYEVLTSDKAFADAADVPSASRRRPDILAFKTGDPYQNVVLVEFKRADRKNENPAQQLTDYADLLRRGGKRRADGVTMPGIALSVRIDGIAVCTLTPELNDRLRRGPGNLKHDEEEGRWFGSQDTLNLCIEVLDFSTFLRRAEQRNRAFFSKLGLT